MDSEKQERDATAGLDGGPAVVAVDFSTDA